MTLEPGGARNWTREVKYGMFVPDLLCLDTQLFAGFEHAHVRAFGSESDVGRPTPQRTHRLSDPGADSYLELAGVLVYDVTQFLGKFEEAARRVGLLLRVGVSVGRHRCQ